MVDGRATRHRVYRRYSGMGHPPYDHLIRELPPSCAPKPEQTRTEQEQGRRLRNRRDSSCGNDLVARKGGLNDGAFPNDG